MDNKEKFVEFMKMSFVPRYKVIRDEECNFHYVHFDVPFDEIGDLIDMFSDTEVQISAFLNNKKEVFDAWVCWSHGEYIPKNYMKEFYG